MILLKVYNDFFYILFMSLKKTAQLLLFLLLIFAIFRLYFHFTDDFTVNNIIPKQTISDKFDIEKPSTEKIDEITEILAQNFSYLGKGAQSFALQSSDGQYVLKFFKFKHLNESLLITWLPFKQIVAKHIAAKKRKTGELFNGYLNGYLYSPKFSGLVYIHLLPTNYLRATLKFTDKLGLKHQINADSALFVLQKKGICLRDHFKSLIKKDDVTQIKDSVFKIMQMYWQQYQMGLYDRDHGVLKNCGFIGDQPFHLDLGKLTRNDKIKQVQFAAQDLQIVLYKIDSWLQKNYPAGYLKTNNFIKLKYHGLTGLALELEKVDQKFIKNWRHAL